jgi:hypothetical protein
MSVMNTKRAPRKADIDAKRPEIFTVRDMNRNTAAVLETCRQHGRVVIRQRNGEQFAITQIKPDAPNAELNPALAERIRAHLERMKLLRERMRALGVKGPATPEGIDELNRIIAGDE